MVCTRSLLHRKRGVFAVQRLVNVQSRMLSMRWHLPAKSKACHCNCRRLPPFLSQWGFRDTQVARTAASLPASSKLSAESDDEMNAGEESDEEDLDDLMVELKDCDTMADILEVVTDEAAGMSPKEAAFALYRVAYMAKNMPSKGALAHRKLYMAIYMIPTQFHISIRLFTQTSCRNCPSSGWRRSQCPHVCGASAAR